MQKVDKFTLGSMFVYILNCLSYMYLSNDIHVVTSSHTEHPTDTAYLTTDRNYGHYIRSIGRLFHQNHIRDEFSSRIC